MVEWENGGMGEWWNGRMVEWAKWANSGMVERWNGQMVECENGGMVEWLNGRVFEWWNESRGAFCCACSVNFSLIRETAAMRPRRFPTRESRKKRSSKIRRKKQWFEYLRQPFFSFFLL